MLSLSLSKRLKVALRFAPIAILATLVLLLLHPVVFAESESTMYKAITLDLLLTLPLVYWLSIRKTAVPNITVVPVFVLGLILGSILIPTSHQSGLEIAKTWVLPLVELCVVSLVIYKVIALRKQFKGIGESSDFMSRLRLAVSDTVPKPVVGALTTEISMFYYALFSWKKPVLANNEYSYHRNNGLVALLYALLMAVLVETVGLHFILAQWNETLAWILSGLSIYTGIQVFALIKSVTRRPIVLQANELFLRNGLFGECRIDLEDIQEMEVYKNDLPEEYEKMKKLSLFQQNLVFHFNKDVEVMGLYGTTKKVKSLAFYADEATRLIEQIKNFKALNATT